MLNVYIPPAGPIAMECWLEVKNTIDSVLVTHPSISLFISGNFNSRLGTGKISELGPR